MKYIYLLIFCISNATYASTTIFYVTEEIDSTASLSTGDRLCFSYINLNSSTELSVVEEHKRVVTEEDFSSKNCQENKNNSQWQVVTTPILEVKPGGYIGGTIALKNVSTGNYMGVENTSGFPSIRTYSRSDIGDEGPYLLSLFNIIREPANDLQNQPKGSNVGLRYAYAPNVYLTRNEYKTLGNIFKAASGQTVFANGYGRHPEMDFFRVYRTYEVELPIE